MSLKEGSSVVEIVKFLKNQIGIPDENIPTVYFWVFNLINATRESNAKLQSGKTINAPGENGEEEEEEEDYEEGEKKK